ncbi:activator of HSP90 ATPase [Sinomicrobium pectinilyticum]|uniref:Activator of HSP90 ATPase n=1 Tax=Sinomicrobium pectinilyticum TaxID=1084421 RepID=A0A3N0F375_SINP1|nr:SRPBCC family protein [Sinomicrobium pectinilyticum]RNL94479.1 activator of HSP90 ATPase [Sinomicrobium pectinilyticum]
MEQITVKSIVQSPVAQVWELWTKPEHITKWNFASEDWHCPSAENDLKVGGKLKSRMEAKDGSFGFDFEATYNQIVDYKKIVYTIADSRKVTTDFRDLDGSTEVITIFDAETTNPIEMQREGWQAILDNFKTYTETR